MANEKKKTTTAQKQLFAEIKKDIDSISPAELLKRQMQKDKQTKYPEASAKSLKGPVRTPQIEATEDGEIRFKTSEDAGLFRKQVNARQNIERYYESRKKENPYSVMNSKELYGELIKLNDDYGSGRITEGDYFKKKDTVNTWRIQNASEYELDDIIGELKREKEDYEKLSNASTRAMYAAKTQGAKALESSSYYGMTENYGAHVENEKIKINNAIKFAESRKKEIAKEKELLAKKKEIDKKYKKIAQDIGAETEKQKELDSYDMMNSLYEDFEGDELALYQGLNRINPEIGTEYYKEMESLLELRASKRKQSEAAEFGEQHPYLAGLKAVGLNIVGGAPAAIDNLTDLVTDREVNTHDATSRLVRESQALRQGGSQYMQKKYGEVASWAYNTGLSIVENAIVMGATAGIGGALGIGTKAISGITSGSMAMNAASNQMINIADRGGNDAQIIIGGIAAGAAEYIFEKYSIENLLSPGNGSKFLLMLRQSGIEASEETLTEIANIFSDAVIMGRNSESNARARALVMDGMSAEEATKQVFRENLEQILQAGASGFVSGGVMGGSTATINNVMYNNKINSVARTVSGSPAALDAVIRLGNEVNNNEAKFLGELIQEGATPDAKQVRTLVESVANDSITKDASLPGVVKVIGAIEGRNSDYYNSQEAIDTANAVLKMTNGTATKADYALIKRSEGARTIVLSAEGTKAWDSLKAEADRRMRSAEYGMRNDTPHPSPAVTLSPQGEGSGGKYRYAGKTKSGIKKYVTDFPADMDTKTREKVFKKRIKTIFNLGAVKLNTDTKKIQIEGDRFTVQKNLYGDEIASEKERQARINSLYDMAEILSDSKFEGKEIEESYNDPTVKPKNQAHKDVKYWYKFKNTISMDGVIYDVVFNIRDKGKQQYQYLIEFHEKNGDNSNQPYGSKNLRRTLDELSPEDSISKDKATVNSKDMQKVEKNASDNVHKSEKDARSEKVPSPEEAKKAENVNNGIVVTEESKQLKKENFKAYNNIGKLATSLKTRAVVVSGLKSSKGEALVGQLKGGVIYVNADVGADKISRWAALHEASHLIKQKEAKIWQSFENYAIKRLKDTGEYKNKYSLKKGDYETNEINEELACDYIGDLFESEAELTEFIRTDKNLAVKIRDGFFNALSRWGLFGERKKAQALWLKAYQAAMKNDVKSQINKKSVAGTRVEESSVSEDKSDYDQFLSDNGGGLHTFRPAKEKGWLSQQWITKRSKGNEEIAKSLNQISDIISNDFGVPINNRSFSDEDVAGSFNLTAEAIHTRAKNDIITISHEIGHLLDKKLKLQKLDGIYFLTKNFDKTLAALGYSEKSKKAEAVGEFVRMYLTNKNVAELFCPEFFEDFEDAIEKSEYKKAVEKLSGAVNAYLSAKTSERIDLAISDKTKEKSIRSKLAEIKKKFPELWNKFQYEFVDRYYAIGRAQGKVYAKNPEGKYDAHTLATNSLNSAARSAYILTKSFVTIEGEEIGKSFIDCLEPIANKKTGIRKKNISELNRYLVLKHALEWIDPKTEGAHKKRVFADESLENPEVLKAEIEKIEKDLPGVKEAAENIYQYIRNLKKYWGIDAGLMTQELSDKLDKMYPNYVPFFREGDPKTITGARTNLANQRAPILEATGGEGMIVNPLESIIGLTNKYVKTASRNMAMQAIAHMADNVGGTGFIIERASGEQQSALEGNEILEEKADAPEASPEELRSITTEEDVWTKATKNGKGFASVLIDGERVWYQINDEQLFNAVADMEPKRLNAFLRGCNVVLNLKRALITSSNPLFAGTNAVRDAITAYNNIDINNPFSYLRAYFTAFYHVIRKNPDYKRWCAMGGGHSSELSANMDAVKRELGKAMRNPKAKAFSWIIHPIQAIASVNDAIESTPRLMAFEHEMKKSGDVHKAINKADDITTNFKRGGRTAKNLNNVFMFSNAAIQGLDRTLRSFTKNETEHGLRNRIIKYSVVATLATLFQMAINRRDEETEEDYKNLSSYMKHSNYVISKGGGKFLRIPTAREQDMLRVIIADAVNYAFGDKEAFDGLLGFAVDTLWPWYVELPQNTDGKSMLDIMTEMFINTARNTPFGFLTDFAANYDFTGKPIVSSKYDDVPRKEQYDERTSKLAVWLGKLTNESPLKIDYIINSNFGILGTINKSLFPMDKNQKDKSIGFISRWVADSYYSTDVLDKVYLKNEAEKMKFQGDDSGKNLAEYKKTSMAADFITQYNKAVKALPEEEKRNARKRLLDIINNWGNGKSASEEELIRLYDATGEDMFITAPKLSISTTTGKRDMTENEYVELVEKYTAGYEALFAEVIASGKYKNADDYTKVELLKDADSYALNSAKAEIFPDFEMPKWQTEIFEGKETASETFSGRVEADAFDSAKKEWSNTNFNFDESKYSEAEVSSMNEFEKSAAAFYTSQEMGIPYEEGKYRRVQVYHDYLSDTMSLEEFAGIKAYANKVASTMGEGSTENMSTKELQAYLNTLDYDTKTKGALFEAIGNKPWKNPYVGGKVGDGTRFPVITTSPVASESIEIEIPETEPKTKTYSNKQTSQKSGAKNKSKYTPIQTIEIRRVEKDAESYYNSPRLTNYNGSKLRHINVYETKLKPYMSLDNYAKIRAEAYGNKSTITPADLEQYLSQLDFEEQIKAALFEAIGEENWENPFEG